MGYKLLSLGYALWQRRLGSTVADRMKALRTLPVMVRKRRLLDKRISATQMMARLQRYWHLRK